MAETDSAAVVRTSNEHKFAYQDLRDWLEEAEKLGELEKITGASWEEDIGMAATVANTAMAPRHCCLMKSLVAPRVSGCCAISSAVNAKI